MDGSGSSFIPRRPTKGKPAAKSFRKVYVLSYVSYLVFFTTLLAVGGIYAYQWTLSKQLHSLQQELISQKSLFSQTDLNRVRNLDYRIDAVRDLINSHASILTLLRALDRTIAEPVQLLSFNYERKEDIARPTLALTAAAQEFDEVIFQEQILSGNAVTDGLTVESVELNTQPIDQEQLDLGVEQVVHVVMRSELPMDEINFNGFIPADEENDFSITNELDEGNDGLIDELSDVEFDELFSDAEADSLNDSLEIIDDNQ